MEQALILRQLARPLQLTDDAALSPVQQTQANSVFKLTDRHRAFAIKWVASADFSGVNRFHQFALQEHLAHRGLAPHPLWLSDDGRLWVESWLQEAESVAITEKLITLAKTLAHIHAQPITGRPLDLPQRWAHYCQEARLPATHPLVLEAENLKSVMARYDDDTSLTLCHNDLHLNHILIKAGSIKVIDWEYAAMGNRYFDLVSCALINQLSDAQSHALCRYYADEAGIDEMQVRQGYKQQEPIVALTNALWLSALEMHSVGEPRR